MSLRSLIAWSTLSGAVLVLGLYRLAGTAGVSYDDVFIVLVYAKHLLASGHFYWNVEDGYIDGFTSLLDLLLKTVAASIYPDDRLQAAWWATLLFYLATPIMGMALVASFQETVTGWRRFLGPAIAGLLLAGNASLAVAAASLLEGPVFVFLILVAMWLAFRPHIALAPFVAVLCLLPLARPEGLGAALLLAAWHIYAERGAPVIRRLSPLLLFLLFVAGFTAWRIHTFGYWAPNTYYAKVSDNRWNEVADGLAYVWSYAKTPVGALVCVLLIVLPPLALVQGWGSGVEQRRFVLLGAFGLCMLGAVIVAGGDSYEGSRFMVVPAAVAIVTLGAAAAGLTGRWRALPTVLALALVLTQFWVDRHWKRKIETVQREWPVSEKRFECDRWLAGMLSPLIAGLTVAQSDYQVFKYFADHLYVIDLHGLNDHDIAHLPWPGQNKWGKFRVENGLQRRPSLWFFGHTVGDPRSIPISGTGMRRAFTDPRIYEKNFGYTAHGAARDALIDNYRPATVRCGLQIYNFLVETSAVSRLRALGVTIGGP